MNINVLIVDDDEDILEFISFKLQNSFDVITKHDGEECWNYLQSDSDNPDVIVLDIMMPKMDGFEVLKKIQKKEDLTQIPILMLTAIGRDDDVVKALKMGAEDYIQKPFSVSELEERIKRVLE